MTKQRSRPRRFRERSHDKRVPKVFDQRIRGGALSAISWNARQPRVRLAAAGRVDRPRFRVFHAFTAGRAGLDEPSVEVLHEDHFVLLLVVDELIDLRSNQQEAEATRSQTFLVPNPRVFGGIVGVGDRGMVEIFQPEACAGIRDPVDQHPVRSHARDTDFPLRIQLAAPFDRVLQQLTERVAHRLDHVQRQVRPEPLDHRLELLHGCARTGDQQLDPIGLGRDHFDAHRYVGRLQRVMREVQQVPHFQLADNPCQTRCVLGLRLARRREVARVARDRGLRLFALGDVTCGGVDPLLARKGRRGPLQPAIRPVFGAVAILE